MKAAGLRDIEDSHRQLAAEPSALPVVSHDQADFRALTIYGGKTAETDRFDTCFPLVFRDQLEMPTTVDGDQLPE